MALSRRIAGPWPERPVSAANKSGKDNASPQGGLPFSRMLKGG